MSGRRSHDPLKLAVVGAPCVGKTFLVNRIASKPLPAQFVLQIVWYIPTIEDYTEVTLTMDDGVQFYFGILDTAGEEEYAALREIYMKQMTAFCLCFSVTDRHSFEIHLHEFYQQILLAKDREYGVPMVLVGCKCDLEEKRVVSQKEATELAENWGIPFVETSGKTGQGAKECFSQIAKETVDGTFLPPRETSLHPPSMTIEVGDVVKHAYVNNDSLPYATMRWRYEIVQECFEADGVILESIGAERGRTQSMDSASSEDGSETEVVHRWKAVQSGRCVIQGTRSLDKSMNSHAPPGWKKKRGPFLRCLLGGSPLDLECAVTVLEKHRCLAEDDVDCE